MIVRPRPSFMQLFFVMRGSVVPRILPQLLASYEPGVAQRVTTAMMQMVKLDIAELQRAAISE